MTPEELDAARLRRAARRAALETRARILQSIRAFFIDQGFCEVETPVRIPAPAPERHIDAPPCAGGFLQTSPELAMKRLLAAGFPKIFQLCRVFREGERGGLHLPEFTLLEWYRADADYAALMADCEGLFRRVAADLGVSRLTRRGVEADLDLPWERLTVREAFARHAGISPEAALEAGGFDERLAMDVEPRLGHPAPLFLCDYPASQAALARLKPDDPTLAERVELYVAGVELANGFSELTDPAEQRARFLRERDDRAGAGAAVYPLPEPFLRDLAHMPPSAGMALGIDRLVMLFCGAQEVSEVVAFSPEEL